jgi:multicomponent Na+:H+ antiporter subunit E
MTRAEPEFSPWRSVWRQLPLLIALIALWVLLWDHVDALTIVTGVVLAIAVTRLLYLPPVLLSGRFNPWRALLLGLRMMFDVAVASLQVAFLALDPRSKPMNAIIAVQLLTRSDLVTTLTSEAISVVPGTVVVDIDRERGLLYLHALGTRTEADLERTHRSVLGTEERIVLAIGTREQAGSVLAARRDRRALRRSKSGSRSGSSSGSRSDAVASRDPAYRDPASRDPASRDQDPPKGGPS